MGVGVDVSWGEGPWERGPGEIDGDGPVPDCWDVGLEGGREGARGWR